MNRISLFLKSEALQNSFWMISGKVVSIFGVIFVTSFLAKYIGPENFGKLTFASSIFAIVQTIAMFGSDNLIFQKTSKNRKIGERIIHTARPIRNAIYFLCSFFIVVYLYIYVDKLTFIFSIASFASFYFLLHDVYSIYFDALLKSKVNAIFNTLSLAVVLFIRYMIVVFELSPEWLCLPVIMITFLPFIMRLLYYRKNRCGDDVFKYSRVLTYRRFMLNAGSKLVLYSLSVAIFTKTSQLFLGIKSQEELGVYTAATTLGTSFYFALSALISSYMTLIYKETDYNKSQNMVARLNSMVIIFSLFVYAFFYIFGEYVVIRLYGEEFRSATEILNLMVVVTLFSGLSTVAEKYIIKFGEYGYLQKKTLVLVVLNLILSFFLVYFYGLYGAVFSNLITELLSTTIFNYFFRRGAIIDTHKRIFLISTYR